MSTKAEPQGGARLLIDLGPLLVFFLANFFAPVPSVMKIFVATGAFIIAMVAAMILFGDPLPQDFAIAVVFGDHGGGPRRPHHLAAQ